MSKGIHLDQIGLFSAINKEICKQVPGLPAEPRLMNCVIAAANMIVAEFAKPIVKATPGMGLEAWLDSDDVGASSLFMAWILSSGQFSSWWGRKQPEPAYPRDPDDLGRCIRLIEAVPEFAERLDVLRADGRQWTAIVDNWAEWVELYKAGDEILYDVMQAAYEE